MAIKPDDILPRDTILDSIERLSVVENKIRLAKNKIALGRGEEAESNERRLKAELRQREMQELEAEEEAFLIVTPGFGQEAHIGERNNILSGEFLEIGILASRSVCRITRGPETGTGFLVGNGILVTNFHVISTANQSRSAIFEFLVDDNTIGKARNSQAYVADPDRFFHSDKDIDLCFVALREMEDSPPLRSYGWLPLLRDEGKVLVGDPVNIIQHPKGQTKRVVVHQSTFILVDNEGLDAFCWYNGDTDKGSSGSPVLNSRWEVVALHHQAVPATDKNGHVLDINGKTIAQDRIESSNVKIKWVANEGIRTSRIVSHIEAQDLGEQMNALRDELLDLWSRPLATITARKASLKGSNTD